MVGMVFIALFQSFSKKSTESEIFFRIHAHKGSLNVARRVDGPISPH